MASTRTCRTGIGILAIGMLAGCSESSPNEVGELPKAYAQMLLLSQQYRADSTIAANAIDSALATYGYDDRTEIENELKRLSTRPDHLRAVLDSTQRILEAIQQGKEKAEVQE